ncbi:MAG: tRNA uridine-5-carboxymethylaminomethyl(34) synthesis enzyme MnmG [Planctomycetota bacterium]
MDPFAVIIVGGGHAGVEAAWAAANALGRDASVCLLTMRADKIGTLSCNPAIGGLAKGQLVREIDALGGLMGLAADATGIQFKVLNTSRGPAVHGPRCQSDKELYPLAVQSLIRSRPEIRIIEGSVEGFLIDDGASGVVRVHGVRSVSPDGVERCIRGDQVVLTTGTFMRGLMHTGEVRTRGGRHGEASAEGISDALRGLGLELGRLRTGTPPRISRSSIDWDAMPIESGDAEPVPFSDLSPPGCPDGWAAGELRCDRFPRLEQIECRQTTTHESAHELIRSNLHRAPMHTGDLADGPRYCPSIEDKAVRFADRTSHGVFLEPESLGSDSIYCNGIATSLPADVQDVVVHTMPGCERAEILRWGYAVEYDMVRPHQIDVTGAVRSVRGLYLAGQINGTSGYEEAAAQGWVAGINAAHAYLGEDRVVLGRDQAYIGVLMDDLVTKTPVEPYRMFTSRAEHRLLLRSDNASDRLTPLAAQLGLLERTELGGARLARMKERTTQLHAGRELMRSTRSGSKLVLERCREAGFDVRALETALFEAGGVFSSGVLKTLHAESRYEPYVERERAEIKRRQEQEHRRVPDWIDFESLTDLRTEARLALCRYRPETLGQASRLEGITPADLTLLRVMVERARRSRASAETTD